MFEFPAEVAEDWRRAERAVLGAILVDNTVAPEARGIIESPAWFADARHTVIFEAMGSLVDANVPVDVVTLARELRARDRLNTVGGAQYLGELTDDIPTGAHIAAHARLVVEAHQMRAGADAGIRAAFAAAAGDLGRVRAALAAGSEEVVDRASRSTLARIDTIVTAQVETLGRRAEEGLKLVQGLPWCLPSLNRWTRGMHGGQFIVIAARPSEGKSAIVEQQVIHGAKARPEAGAHVVFTLEMERDEWGERAIACEAEVDVDVVRGAIPATQEDVDRILAAVNRLHGLPIFVDDASRHTPATMRARCAEIQRRHGLAAIYLDYLQLAEADATTDRHESPTRSELIGRITRAAKRMAKDFHVPFVAAAQINRESEKGGKRQRPALHNLRESGDIEQDANVVVLLHRTSEKAQGEGAAAEITREVTAIVEKNRGGRTGDVAMLFRGAYQRFYEIGPEAGEDARDARGDGGDDYRYGGRAGDITTPDLPPDPDFAQAPRRQLSRAYDGGRGAIEAPAEDDYDPNDDVPFGELG